MRSDIDGCFLGMTMDIGHTTFIVNDDGVHCVDIHKALPHDRLVSTRKNARWDTFEKRVRWVIKEGRPHVVSSKEDWSLKAGLSRQYLSSAIDRIRKKGGSMSFDALLKLTDVPGINIDLTWLGSGRGSPDGTAHVAVDSNPYRAAAAKRALADGCPADVISEIQADPKYNSEDWGKEPVDAWYGVFMRTAFKRAQRMAEARAPKKAG